MKAITKLTLYFAFCLFWAFSNLNAQIITYDIYGATSTSILGINNEGYIVGYFTNSSGNHGFLDIGYDTIILNYPNSISTVASGINDSNKIVGYYANASTPTITRGFIYDINTQIYQDITTSWLGSPQNLKINDISNNGYIVGECRFGTFNYAFSMYNGINHTFYYDFSYKTNKATGVNDDNYITGYVIEGISTYKGFFGKENNLQLFMIPGAWKTRCYGINNLKYMIGDFNNNRGFIYNNWANTYFEEVLIDNSTEVHPMCINDSMQYGGYYKDLQGITHGFIVRKIDLGFRPHIDGWKFPNLIDYMWNSSDWMKINYEEDIFQVKKYGSKYTGFLNYINTTLRLPLGDHIKKSYFPDWATFVETYGENNCYELNGNLKMPMPKALVYWDKIANMGWGGSCHGFATSAFMLFQKKIDFCNNYPDATILLSNNDKTNSINLNNGIRSRINALQTACGIDSVYLNKIHQKDKSPAEVLKEIKKMILTQQDDLRTLSIFNCNGSGGHSLCPYKVEVNPENADEEFVYVYDCNIPNDTTRKITINKIQGIWSYKCSLNSSGQEVDWGGNRNIYLNVPVNYFYSLPPVYTNFNTLDSLSKYITVMNETTAAIRITNPANKAIGFSNDKVIDSIANATPIIRETGYESKPIGYFIANDSYHIIIQYKKDSSGYVTLMTDTVVYEMFREDVKINQTDIINYDIIQNLQNKTLITANLNNRAFWLNSNDSQSKKADLNTIIKSTKGEKLISMKDINYYQFDTLITKADVNGGIYTANKGVNKKYNLNIVLNSDTINGCFRYDSIIMNNHSAHTIVADWDYISTQPVKIYIDNNIDGTIDDSMSLSNQALPYLNVSGGETKYVKTQVTDTLFINNMGGGIMNYSAISKDTSWLKIITGATGVDKGNLIVNVLQNNNGARYGNLIVTASGANNSPDTISILQKGVINTPDSVSATDGSYSNKIVINWKKSLNATHYKLYRDTVSDTETYPISNWQTDTFFVDNSNIITGKTYYYTVKAAASSSGLNTSEISKADDGYALNTQNKIVNLKLFLQGLYNPANHLLNKAQNENGDHYTGDIADIITLEIHKSTSAYSLVYAVSNNNLKTNGTTVFSFPYYLKDNYYIAVKHRNHLETWSSSPVSFAADTINYDFTTSASKAYSDNQKQVSPNTFAMYVGDVNQDGVVDLSDLVTMDGDLTNGTVAYIVYDLNGDGVVDISDLVAIDENLTNGVEVMTP
jgi:hypothetical protein